MHLYTSQECFAELIINYETVSLEHHGSDFRYTISTDLHAISYAISGSKQSFHVNYNTKLLNDNYVLHAVETSRTYRAFCYTRKG